MDIWTRITEALGRFAETGSLRDALQSPPAEKTVAFAIAIVALGAKMAKADGRVTRDEVDAFKQVFAIAPGDEQKVARVFDAARADVSGFDGYARQIEAMFPGEDGRRTLEDILDGLFHIAGADGVYAPEELAFLAQVAEIFHVSPRCFERLRARHDPERGDPYALLGLSADAPMAEIVAARNTLVRESHPDRLRARGVPEEAIQIGAKRTAAVTDAFARIRAERGVS